jgi:hypothetical protein
MADAQELQIALLLLRHLREHADGICQGYDYAPANGFVHGSRGVTFPIPIGASCRLAGELHKLSERLEHELQELTGDLHAGRLAGWRIQEGPILSRFDRNSRGHNRTEAQQLEPALARTADAHTREGRRNRSRRPGNA